ncbi:MAG: DUF2079 domain-containing protein, partial [Desulfobacteraceae bacterium]|nr:DUF2079 domain-containing protein [Desulfobacteraceae bacterium]
FFLSRNWRFKGPFSWSKTILLIAVAYMPIAQYLKYKSLHFYTDFSHWAQILNNIVTTGKPECLNQEFMVPGTLNYLSVHFAPLLYVLAIPFRLWPRNETIILLNCLLMASASIPAYKLAYIHYKDKSFSVFIALLLLWYPTFQYIVLYEFEMLRFSIPIIFWMLYFWEKRNLTGYFIFVFLAVLVREEVGLTIMMFGLYLFFAEKQHRVGITTALVGLVAFFSIMQIFMPALTIRADRTYISASSFADFGNTPYEVIVNVISHPIQTMIKILRPVKLSNIFMFFLPLLFVPLLAPAILLITLANLGVGLLSTSVTHCSYMMYYLSPSIPFIFYAFIKAWPKLLKILRALMKKSSLNQDADVDSAAMMGVLSSLLVANIFFGPSFLSLQFWFKNIRPAPFRTQNFHYSVYKVTEHHSMVEEFCELIPDSAIVSAEQFLAPRLFKKKGTMVFPQLESVDGKTQADYAFIDKTNPMKTGTGAVPGSWDGLRQNPQVYYDLVEKYPDRWELVHTDEGYYLYRRIKPDLQTAG